jgi:hypothetical protein
MLKLERSVYSDNIYIIYLFNEKWDVPNYIEY